MSIDNSKTVKISLGESSSPVRLLEDDLEEIIQNTRILDKSVTLIIDNSGKILLVKAPYEPSTEVSSWRIPNHDIDAENPAESAAKGLQDKTGLQVLPNHLLPLGVTAHPELGLSFHLFLHKISQVRYSTPYSPLIDDCRSVQWMHKLKLAESIKTRQVDDFGTVSLFEKAVLLGII